MYDLIITKYCKYILIYPFFIRCFSKIYILSKLNNFIINNYIINYIYILIKNCYFNE